MDLEAIMIDAQRDRDRLRREREQLQNAIESGLQYRSRLTPIDPGLDMLDGCRVWSRVFKGHVFHAAYQMVLAEIEDEIRNAEDALREAAAAFGKSASPNV